MCSPRQNLGGERSSLVVRATEMRLALNFWPRGYRRPNLKCRAVLKRNYDVSIANIEGLGERADLYRYECIQGKTTLASGFLEAQY